MNECDYVFRASFGESFDIYMQVQHMPLTYHANVHASVTGMSSACHGHQNNRSSRLILHHCEEMVTTSTTAATATSVLTGVPDYLLDLDDEVRFIFVELKCRVAI